MKNALNFSVYEQNLRIYAINIPLRDEKFKNTISTESLYRIYLKLSLLV